MYVFGVAQEEKERMANMLNCALGALPMKYLGIPVSDSHLYTGTFSLTSRLDPWRGNHLTWGQTDTYQFVSQ